MKTQGFFKDLVNKVKTLFSGEPKIRRFTVPFPSRPETAPFSTNLSRCQLNRKIRQRKAAKIARLSRRVNRRRIANEN
jgi:hypothetical protein